ncbi:MAG: DUF2239 family protein [Luteolibacter sp.]
MNEANCTAFIGSHRVAFGSRRSVALALRGRGEDGAMPLVFDDATGKPIDLDLRGTEEEVLGRLPAEAVERSGPGRPKLGVVAREVTLLPRHWEWLGAQPGGASVALRKLVEDARRANAGADDVRLAREAAYHFMHAIGGDRVGYEEAMRALFAGDASTFTASIANWPADLRDHAAKLAAGAWPGDVSSSTPPASS